MLDQDVPVWYRFLDKYGPAFQALYYDCLLGGPFHTPEQEADPLWRMWRYNTSKRADSIAELSTEIWIIEVSAAPGLRAIGQLLVYKSLWIEDPKIFKPVQLALVAAQIDNDLAGACAAAGIQVYII
jgi:hypothetical protein